MIKTIEWTESGVVMLDQKLLPAEEVYRTYVNHFEVAEAIRSMVIRGAPAIGIAAADDQHIRARARLSQNEWRRKYRGRSCAPLARISP